MQMQSLLPQQPHHQLQLAQIAKCSIPVGLHVQEHVTTTNKSCHVPVSVSGAVSVLMEWWRWERGVYIQMNVKVSA